MKLPKKIKRFCPYCLKKTEQKIDLVNTGHKRGSLRWGSKQRAKLRHNSGKGNLGKYSKPAIKSWKRKSKTTTRKVLIYTCSVCKKSKHAKKSWRVGKLMIGEK